MRRLSLAMTLGLGFTLAATGCGPTAKDAAIDPPFKQADAIAKSEAAAPKADPSDPDAKNAEPEKGSRKAGGGAPGMSSETMKGMQSDAYRNLKPVGDQPAKAADTKPSEAKPAEEPKKEGETKKDPIVLSDDELTNIKKLPSEVDQKLALAQKICLVGEDEGKPNHLGSMGMPIKETVKGKTVFLCCKGCVEDLKKDPDKYLSKLGK